MPRVSQEHLEARRRQILDAARRCYLRNGFHATSMHDILREAGLSAGAVYRYFPGKDELTAAIAADSLARLREAFEWVLQTDPPPPIDQAFTQLGRTIQRMDAEYGLARIAIQVWSEAVRSPDLAQRLRDLVVGVRALVVQMVRIYQERGEIGQDVPAEKIGPVIAGIFPGFMLQHVLFGDVDAEMVGDAVRALVGGRLRGEGEEPLLA
jgi:TetR/AcrR family transcriptional regulator, transcriptional repressor of aconitase